VCECEGGRGKGDALSSMRIKCVANFFIAAHKFNYYSSIIKMQQSELLAVCVAAVPADAKKGKS
jgi:hypothetical protein